MGMGSSNRLPIDACSSFRDTILHTLKGESVQEFCKTVIFGEREIGKVRGG